MEVQLLSFSALELGEDEWSVSRFSHFTRWEGDSGTRPTGVVLTPGPV